MAQPAQDRHLRHAFGVRVGVSVAAGDRDERAPGPDRRRVSTRSDGAAGRGVSHLRRLRRLLPQGLQSAGAVLSRAVGLMSALLSPPSVAEQANVGSRPFFLLRILLPVAVLAAGIAAWELVVRLNEIP